MHLVHGSPQWDTFCLFILTLTLLILTYVLAFHVLALACDYCILPFLHLLSLLLITPQVHILHSFHQ